MKSTALVHTSVHYTAHKSHKIEMKMVWFGFVCLFSSSSGIVDVNRNRNGGIDVENGSTRPRRQVQRARPIRFLTK